MEEFRILKTITIFMISGILLTACNTNSVSTEVEQTQNVPQTYLADRDNSSTEKEEDLTELGSSDSDYGDEEVDGFTELVKEFQKLGVMINDDRNAGTCGENLTWNLADGVLTISGTGDMVDWPAELSPIWSLCDGYGELREVVIEDGVTSIGDYAFYRACYCESIRIPSSVTKIGQCAFAHCASLKSIEIPEQVTEIKDEAFWNCKKLKTITISANVKSIGHSAFYKCSGLEEIHVDETNTVYASEDGVFFNKDKTKLIFYPATKKDSSYTIPSSVKEIEDCAFIFIDSLKEISLPDNLVTIGEWTFAHTGLISVHLPDSVVDIGNFAFYGCQNLKEVVLSKGMKKLKEDVFAECGQLKDIYIPDSIKNINESIFSSNVNIHTLTKEKKS